ncbi:carbohydrate ABC transporter permease [Actinomadura rudentiformis]|uniref:Carbohydrate ABC transporter permease n=1 Tax=Actinomadura rudentiformis TaxID=359158 RepID=A0A6H9Z059_9ACTN|nr:carbohydrate ABC transporter permease [Actinomadura rudentiformis]KAB2350095.1 carbohydrate ABC transporter permease [Actinomadura rudentiformis]
MVRRRAAKTADYVAMTLGGLLFAAPILYMIIGSLKPDGEVLGGLGGFVPRNLSLGNYTDVFRRFDSDATGHLTGFFATSLIVTTIVVVGGLIINSMAGYAFARMRWRGRDLTYAAVLALVVLPFEAIAVPLFYMLNDYRDTIGVQAVPFVANAFSIYLFTTFFRGLPKEIEEAARIDGAGPWRCYLRVVVPMSKPAFATVAILTFLTQWSSFLWPVLMVSDPSVRPLPLAISVFQGQPPFQWGDIMAFGVLMVAPVLVVFLAFQRWFVRSVAATGIKG